MDYCERIKDLLKKVVLYQFSRYDKEKLDKELTSFLKDAEDVLCEAIRRNGGVCYRDYKEEYKDPKIAKELCESDIKNFEMLGLPSGKLIADLIKISLDYENFDKKSLSDKILLFDRLVHAEHVAGIIHWASEEEKSIFGCNIPEIKKQVEEEIKEIYR
jgi:hypothetical protein